MKLSLVIKVWDLLHVKNTGDLGFCDLVKAVEDVEGVEHGVDSSQPETGGAEQGPVLPMVGQAHLQSARVKNLGEVIISINENRCKLYSYFNQSWICAECGHDKVKLRSRFCPSCGSPIKWVG